MSEQRDFFSARQALSSFGAFLLALILSQPFLNAPAEHYHALFLVPILFIPALFLLLKVFTALRRKISLSFPDLLARCFGKFGGVLFCIFYSSWLFLALAVFFTRTVGLVAFVLPRISFLLVSLLVAALSLTASLSGFRPISRMSEIIFPIGFAIALFSFALLSPTFDPDLFIPVRTENLSLVIRIFLRYAGNALLFFSLFFVTAPDSAETLSSNAKKFALPVLLLSALFFVAQVLTLGSELSASIPAPYIASVRLVSVLGLFEKVDILLLFTLLLCSFLLFSFLLVFILSLIKPALPAKGSFPVLFLLLSFLCFVSDRLAKDADLFTFVENRLLLPANFVFCLILPFLMLGILSFKEKSLKK